MKKITNIECAFEGPVLGFRMPENGWKKSSPRYEKCVTPEKSGVYVKKAEKAAPNLRQEKSASATKCNLLSGTSGIPKEKKMFSSQIQSTRALIGFTPARLTAGKRWYIEWYSFDPDAGKLRRKRVSVPHIKPLANRRRYANDMTLTINQNLASGWNPFLQLADSREYALFDDICEQYSRYLLKLTESGNMRPKTFNGYQSYLKNFREWNKTQARPVVYIYQLKSAVIDSFLDNLWIDEGRSPRTRDNYLGWLRTFCEWMMEKHYISDNPTSGMTNLLGKKYGKNRTCIERADMLRLREYLNANDKHMLLCCYVLYYCLIRPREMSYIRIRDINVAKGTVFIAGNVSKNGKDAVVTLPDCVLKLMLDLEVLSLPCDWYLFSKDFLPGPDYRLPKYFCDAWNKVRTALGFPKKYKFYSLKDTGITDMIKDKTDLLAVRDQARHSSLQMTDLYTPMSNKSANEELRHRKSYF